MFNAARLKLTIWYLLIIMAISIFFSLLIFRALTLEVDRISRMERLRIERRPFNYRVFHPMFLEKDFIREIKKRIAVSLFFINGIILISAGGLGYFLAGKTLRPIVEMVDEQNRFISNASHELRTPLTSLKTAIEVGLRDKKMDIAGAKKLINENLSEINKLQSLSDSLLQLTQYESGGNNFKLEKTSLRKILDEAIKKIDIIAKEKKIQIKNKVRSFYIKGSYYSLTDLFVILLDNAVKYSKTNSEVIITSKKINKIISVFIKDMGIGIAEKDLPKIFERFYRTDKAREKSGYGLGLAIAKKIVDSHHGSIAVKSKLGKGTTVIVSLPLFN